MHRVNQSVALLTDVNRTVIGSDAISDQYRLLRGVLPLGMFVYGGWVRDVLIRQHNHSDVDIDLGLAPNQSMADGVTAVLHIANALGLQHTRTVARGAFVTALRFARGHRHALLVEVVDTAHFAGQAPPIIDLDVNNLVVRRGATRLAFKIDNPQSTNSRTIDSLVLQIIQREFRACKTGIMARVQKMLNRGWRQLF